MVKDEKVRMMWTTTSDVYMKPTPLSDASGAFKAHGISILLISHEFALHVISFKAQATFGCESAILMTDNFCAGVTLTAITFAINHNLEVCRLTKGHDME